MIIIIKAKLIKEMLEVVQKGVWVGFCLLWFYGTSTIVGYLMLNLF